MSLAEYQDAILWVASLSLGAFVLSIVILPLIIIRLPADFFVREVSVPLRISPLRLCLKALKNALGLIFLVAGFIMLFIPGQGILTMLFGVSLMDFPGKRRLQHRIVKTPRVHRSLNWLRGKTNRAPFLLPEN